MVDLNRLPEYNQTLAPSMIVLANLSMAAQKQAVEGTSQYKHQERN